MTARELRAATRGDHERTERAPLMVALLDGRLPAAAYADFLAQLHAVYLSLEAAGDRFADDPVAGAFVDPALRRVPAIERDLLALAGPDWPAELALTAPATAYAARLDACDDPVRFVAHHYTRYLGDLSGGQAIGRVVRVAYGPADFYDFPAIADAKAYKDAYRARLDALDADVLTGEVTVAYGLNAAVFAALAERHLG
jgi:heme oxygenase